jgi:hypothetical protein
MSNINLSFIFAFFSLFSLHFCSILPIEHRYGLDLPPPPPYSEQYITQRLDHFNYEANVNGKTTYQQRYLYADKYWGTQKHLYPNAGNCKGPIFFYTGNESPVTDYYDASGLFTQVLAPKYGALLIFAEHRYFGKSMPFGNSSFDLDKIGFCSADQALADYAVLIRYLKTSLPGADECPVVAFGGSYGGMLTTWFRIQYPDATIGGLAASAPFGFAGSGMSPYSFTDAATATFAAAVPGCDVAIQKAINLMFQLAVTSGGRAQLSQKFQLCTPLQSIDDAYNLIYWAVAGLEDMCMLDYPYPTNYGISVSAWPVNNTCARVLQFQNDLVYGLAYGIGTFYNNSGNWPCYDYNKDVPDFETCCGWNYLYCTVTYLPAGSSGMFPPSPWNATADIEACKSQFGVDLDIYWPIVHWGSMNAIKQANNIIFSNGLLDPWHTQGVLTNLSDSLIAIVIPAAAHHLDLRAPNPADPIYVRTARDQEDAIIGGWIHQFFKDKK